MQTNLLLWLSARTPVEMRTPPDTIPELAHAREQIVTARLRAATLLGSLAVVVTIAFGLQQSPALLAGYLGIVALCWIFAINRQIDYRLRGGVLVIATYLLALNELIHAGYSITTVLYLVGFALLPLSFLSRRVSLSALVLAVVTLALVGVLIHSTAAPNLPALGPTPAEIASICLIFTLVVGAIQSGNFALRRSLEIGWTREYDARLRLEQAHDRLEQRVAERTAELAALNQSVVAAHQTIAAQSQFLSVLQQTTLELLHHQVLPDLCQEVVDRATTILNAPYGELRLYDSEGVTVQTFSRDRTARCDDHLPHEPAPLTWQVFDTTKLVVIDSYAEWAARHNCDNPLNLSAVISIPIMAGNAALGVLVLGRSAAEPPFTTDQVQQGQLFTHTIGLVIERARLYDRALSEIAVRTQAEQALHKQAEQLQQQNAELDDFAHTVAHDLATPLTGLVGYSELMKMAVLRGELQDIPHTCDVIIRTGMKMGQIINEILLLASIRKQSDIPKRPIAMAEIITEVEARLAHRVATTNATIRRPEAWPAVLGYAPWVEEVWANYLDNALKYSGPSPVITLSADRDIPGFVRFWVCDHGPGLPPERRAQLFTHMARSHSARADSHGLGLSIVKRIISRLGGEVGVESAPGQGARFFFTLPVA